MSEWRDGVWRVVSLRCLTDLVDWNRWGKPRQRLSGGKTLPAQSMTIWVVLERSRGGGTKTSNAEWGKWEAGDARSRLKTLKVA